MTSPKQAVVVVLEDSPLEASGWKSILDTIPNIKVAAICQTVDAAKDKCLEVQPDLLIVDGQVLDNMAGGATFAREMRGMYPKLRILGVSKYPEALEYLRGTCDHVVNKTALWDAKDFEMHIKFVLNINPSQSIRLTPAQMPDADELRILKLMACDLKIKQIAQKMDRTEREIKGLRKRLFDKLGVNTDHGAVAIGYQTGLLVVGEKSEDC